MTRKTTGRAGIAAILTMLFTLPAQATLIGAGIPLVDGLRAALAARAITRMRMRVATRGSSARICHSTPRRCRLQANCATQATTECVVTQVCAMPVRPLQIPRYRFFVDAAPPLPSAVISPNRYPRS